MDAQYYVALVRERLLATGFVEESQTDSAFAARRREVKLSRSGIVETVAEVSSLVSQPTPDDLRRFGSSAVASALKGKSKLPRGLGSSLVVYPVLVADVISDPLRDFVSDYAPKHWSIVELPVVVDPSTANLLTTEKTPAWGAAYYRTTRRDAQEWFGPSRTSSAEREAER
jgi:hypothetical protein